MTGRDDNKRHESVGDRAYEWWRDNCQPASGDVQNVSRKRDPAIRARLRRCRSNTEAAAIPAAISLVRRLNALQNIASPSSPDVDAALGLARVLAFVTENSAEGPMKAAGWKRFPGDKPKSQPTDNQPRLAEARFKRLLGVKPGDDQVVAFTRLVTLLGGRVNVAELSRDFLQWDRDTTRRRWAFDYYAASSALPKSDDTSPSEEIA